MSERPGGPPSDETRGDELLRELARIAREDRAEAAESGRRSGRAGTETDDSEDPYDLERPLDEAFRAEMTRRLQAALGPRDDARSEDEATGRGGARGRAGQGTMPSGTGRGGVAVGDGSAATRRLRTRSGARRRLGWLAAAAATAAVLAGWWLVPSAVEREPLPAYTLSWSGGLAALRSGAGDASELPRWGGDSVLDLTLRPATSVDGPVHAHAYLLRGDRVRGWPGPAPEVAPSGAVRVRGRLGAPPPAAGEWTILVLLGRSDDPPRHEEVLAIARGDAPVGRWAPLRQRVEIVPVP